MPDFKVFETNRFIEDIEEVGSNSRKRVYHKIREYVYPQLRKNPYYGNNIRKLVNYNPPTWRYRIGDYRLFYEIDKEDHIVNITAIDIRQKAY